MPHYSRKRLVPSSSLSDGMESKKSRHQSRYYSNTNSHGRKKGSDIEDDDADGMEQYTAKVKQLWRGSSRHALRTTGVADRSTSNFNINSYKNRAN